MVEGWENDNQENGNVPTQHAVIDLDYYSTVEELMEVGPEMLKEVKVSCCLIKVSSNSLVYSLWFPLTNF